MIIIELYRDHRIEVKALPASDRFNAEVRIRRTLSEQKPHIEVVSCYKLTPVLAEQTGATWAKRWVDLLVEENAGDGN